MTRACLTAQRLVQCRTAAKDLNPIRRASASERASGTQRLHSDGSSVVMVGDQTKPHMITPHAEGICCSSIPSVQFTWQATQRTQISRST